MGAELSPNVGFQFSLVWRGEEASVISRCLDRQSSFLAGDHAAWAAVAGDGGFRADVLGQQICVLTQPIARSLDLDHHVHDETDNR